MIGMNEQRCEKVYPVRLLCQMLVLMPCLRTVVISLLYPMKFCAKTTKINYNHVRNLMCVY